LKFVKQADRTTLICYVLKLLENLLNMS